MHTELLDQGSPHCPIFPTAASRRSKGRISVPLWPFTLSGRLPIIALVGRYPTNKLIGRKALPQRLLSSAWHASAWQHQVLSVVSVCYPCLRGKFLTRYSPVRLGSSVQAQLRQRLACVKHSVSVHPEPGSNSSFNISSYILFHLRLDENHFDSWLIFIFYTLLLLLFLS